MTQECVACKKEIFDRKLENEGLLAWKNRMEVSVCAHVCSCPQARADTDARSGRGFAAWERIRTLATSRCCIPVLNGTPGSFGSLRGRKEHTSPMLKSQRRKTEARSLLYFTLSALHRAEAQLMLAELGLLDSTEGKRGLKGLGDFKSILREGQLQGETEILNPWIYLLGTGDIYILNGKQISNTHIGTAEHFVLLMALLYIICEKLY